MAGGDGASLDGELSEHLKPMLSELTIADLTPAELAEFKAILARVRRRIESERN